MKKNVLIGTVLVAMVTAAGAVNAAPSTHSIYLNGLPVAVEGYAIDGNNYLQAARSGKRSQTETNKEFEVSWNNAAKRIDFDNKQGVGGELAAIDAGKRIQRRSYKDGALEIYKGYTINENNYT